jgi:nardilysin
MTTIPSFLFSPFHSDSEYTCYYFEINPAFLHPALQRFAQFFVSPLFAASATKREIRAVDSEFQDCINSDPERARQRAAQLHGRTGE